MTDTMQEPVAWMYELAMAYDRNSGTYSDWQRRVSFDKPNVPRPAIRNLVGLDARPKTLEGK